MRNKTATEGYLKVRQGGAKDLGDTYFRSPYERNYARYLNWMRNNDIKWDSGICLNMWEYEPHTFWFEGIKRGVRSYKPDFRLCFSDGSTEYHEVKGYYDAKSKTKIKRMAKYYPDVKLVLIDGKWFKAMKKRGTCKLIPGWE